MTLFSSACIMTVHLFCVKVGAVNFNILHVLLSAILKQLNIQHIVAKVSAGLFTSTDKFYNILVRSDLE